MAPGPCPRKVRDAISPCVECPGPELLPRYAGRGVKQNPAPETERVRQHLTTRLYLGQVGVEPKAELQLQV